MTISVAIIYRKLPEPYLHQHCWIICFTSNIPARCYASLTLQLIFSRHTVPGSVFESENKALDHKILFFYLFRNWKTLASLSFSRHFDCLSRADPWHQEISGVHKVGFSKFVHSVMPDECVHKPCELNSWTAKFVWNSILRSRYRQISIKLEIQNTYSLCSHSWVILRDLGNFCFIVW